MVARSWRGGREMPAGFLKQVPVWNIHSFSCLVSTRERFVSLLLPRIVHFWRESVWNQPCKTAGIQNTLISASLLQELAQFLHSTIGGCRYYMNICPLVEMVYIRLLLVSLGLCCHLQVSPMEKKYCQLQVFHLNAHIWTYRSGSSAQGQPHETQWSLKRF